MRSLLSLTLLLCTFSFSLTAQTAPFQVALEPLNINELGGLQAFAFGQHNGKWLILGGRLDGLHRRQPFATFDQAGHNNQILVIDPVAQQKWSAPLSSLPVGMQEQLSSTNMEFHQDGDYLYLVGGYGYSNSAGDHITYPNLCAVNVPEVINAVINNTTIVPWFRQINDQQFAVTGGYLNKIYNTFYITGGQRFDGRYNPMNHPTFTQTYTNSIRKFTISDDGTNLVINHLPAITDEANLHRRDYNVVPQIMPNGQEGLTAFSGVFQAAVDLPFLNCVNIDSTGYSVNNDFAQYYNQYHCAHIPIYSAAGNEMHTLFFGGIAQYYDSLGILVQDNNVPFVKTIARVTRNSGGVMAEYKLPVEMPALLGASSEFIPLENVPQYNNDVIKLDELSADTTLIGYIYGGISSSAANVFWVNDGTQSEASSMIFKVFILKNNAVSTHELNAQSTGGLRLQVFPNPSYGNSVTLKFNLKQSCSVNFRIQDTSGKLLETFPVNNLPAGENAFLKQLSSLKAGKTYLITLETPYEKTTQKIIIDP